MKTQVFELMSALCVYSPEGYRISLDALEDYKVRGQSKLWDSWKLACPQHQLSFFPVIMPWSMDNRVVGQIHAKAIQGVDT